MKKIGIIGTRKRNIITDYGLVEKAFFKIYQEGDMIVSGHAAKGGDVFAEKIAFNFGVPITIFPPTSKTLYKYHKGYKYKKYNYIGQLFARNSLIAEHSDILIACLINPHDSLYEIYKRTSGGSEHCIKIFLKKLGYFSFHSKQDIDIPDEIKEKVIIV